MEVGNVGQTNNPSSAAPPVLGARPWPKWIHGFLQPTDAEKISEAVAQAEARTMGEIVPMIVQRSSIIGHVPYVLTLIFLVILLAFEVQHFEFFSHNNISWMLLLISLFCFVISYPLAKLSFIQRLLVPQGDQAFEVEERALLEFYQAGITSTRGRTGILLFISLMEHKAVVLADESISKKLPAETWAQICAEMVNGIKQGKTAEGMISAIQRSGELLAQHFPHEPKNDNELSNQLILKE